MLHLRGRLLLRWHPLHWRMSTFHLGLDEVDMTVELSTDTSGDRRTITRIQQPAGKRHATEAILGLRCIVPSVDLCPPSEAVHHGNQPGQATSRSRRMRQGLRKFSLDRDSVCGRCCWTVSEAGRRI
jgi:hypothetical protein